MSVAQQGARLEARAWGWRHAGRSAWALPELDLAIEPGERVLLAGASGAGKSTLLRGFASVLGGQDEGEQRGELLVDGMQPELVRGRVGLVLQDPDTQIVCDRVGDEVAFGCENLGVAPEEIWPRVEAALSDVGLAVPLSQHTGQLSGGQKQRLALASLLAMQPSAFLLDEPTANLDPSGARSVRDAVERVLDRTGATLLVVEHRVELWADLVDRVIVLDSAGRLVGDGSPKAVFAADFQVLLDAGVWVPGHTPSTSARRPGPAQTLLAARELAVGRRSTPPVLDDVSFDIQAGKITAIVGNNGVGKTTLSLTLAGLLAQKSGTLRAALELARGAGDSPIRWKSKELLTRVGMVFQEPEHQFLTSTVRAEVELGLRALGIRGAELTDRVTQLLGVLGLADLASCNPFTLSGGQKRRLSVATVLVTAPQVIVLDEPTFGQDRNGWIVLAELVAQAARDGSAVVAVSHDEQFVASVADVIVVADAGGTKVREVRS